MISNEALMLREQAARATAERLAYGAFLLLLDSSIAALAEMRQALVVGDGDLVNARLNWLEQHLPAFRRQQYDAVAGAKQTALSEKQN